MSLAESKVWSHLRTRSEAKTQPRTESKVKNHSTFWIIFSIGLKFGLRPGLSHGLMQKVKSPTWAALEISFRGGRAGQARGQGGQAYDGAYMRSDFTED